jgi:hypothetical protein
MWLKIVHYEADFFLLSVHFDPLFFLYSYYEENFEALDLLFSLYSYCIESFKSPVATHRHLLVERTLLVGT